MSDNHWQSVSLKVRDGKIVVCSENVYGTPVVIGTMKYEQLERAELLPYYEGSEEDE